MLAQHLWPMAALVLTGALLGRAQVNAKSNDTINCYSGWDVYVTSDFSQGHEDLSQLDRLLRELYMHCGPCSDHEFTEGNFTQCRDCITDLCNEKFAKELVPKRQSLITCYASSNFEEAKIFHPIWRLCPREHGCGTGFVLNGLTVVGCGNDCEDLGWKMCRRCYSRLCNDRGDYWNYGDPDAKPRPYLKDRKLLSDEAVSVSSPVTRPTALVSVLSLVTAPALGLVWHQQLLMP
uniref:Folate_rec domain-containing protein n=1 Tax=Macrostomum lignano TaxID=282301 RepID=A0A1I8G8I0_9PLAT